METKIGDGGHMGQPRVGNPRRSQMDYRRLAWVVAFAGLAVPALARFFSSPGDDERSAWAIVGGIALSLLVFQLIMWAVSIPSIRRVRALRVIRPDCLSYEVTNEGADFERALENYVRAPRSSSPTQTCTMVLAGEELEFWRGSQTPELFAAIPKKSFSGAQLSILSLPLRRIWGIVLATSTQETEVKIGLVPMSGTGGALSKRHVGRIVEAIETWFTHEEQKT